MSGSKDEEKISSLKVHEWLAITVIIGMIGGLACLASLQEPRIDTDNFESLAGSQGFDVLIKGAVNNPGIYRLPQEMKLKELLILAGVSSNADLRRFHSDTVIKKARTLNVPVRLMITVHLKGAVKEEQDLILPKGSKLEDLIPLVSFSDHANISILKKKQRLKDGEIIHISEIPRF